MTIEVALGGRRRVCFRLRQTEKERSVTVINVLAESETVISQDPVFTTTPLLTSTPQNHTRAGSLITSPWIMHRAITSPDLLVLLKCWIKSRRKWDSPVCPPDSALVFILHSNPALFSETWSRLGCREPVTGGCHQCGPAGGEETGEPRPSACVMEIL